MMPREVYSGTHYKKAEEAWSEMLKRVTDKALVLILDSAYKSRDWSDFKDEWDKKYPGESFLESSPMIKRGLDDYSNLGAMPTARQFPHFPESVSW